MEQLKHECGVAMIRLLKPLEYFKEKYGTYNYALNKLYLLMEKQHNRGQEGAGLACVRLSATPGDEYMFRERAAGTTAITEVFNAVHIAQQESNDVMKPYIGELYMGHLRYSTTGKSGLDYIHPFLRRNNWRAKNLALCGNFNLTNVDEVFGHLVSNGQHPRRYADTHIMLEQVGHCLDREIERLYGECSQQGLHGLDLTHTIEDRVDLANVLKASSKYWDGGYVMCGLTGSGECFAIRDPWGIRTAFWYIDDEVMVLASERPVIQTVLNVGAETITELQPGQALLMNKAGMIRIEQINAPQHKSACSFERIYFSRGSDIDIYRERKMLGQELMSAVYEAVDKDLEHTVFSYIPNTAETAYYGLCEGFENEGLRIRREKVVHKDIKMRTFIAEGNSRNDLAAHVYDITYGSLQPYIDNLVVIDDSIVRGTTLRQSIIQILDRLHPKKTVIVSSAPQIRYPDYYGIDMSSMEQFIAFKAALALLEDRGMGDVVTQTYNKCKAQENLPAAQMKNYVKDIYAPFTDEEISLKMAELLTPSNVTTRVQIIFQTVDGLHTACPNHTGDWYFTGNYPTPGGVRMLNKAFINYIENNNIINQ